MVKETVNNLAKIFNAPPGGGGPIEINLTTPLNYVDPVTFVVGVIQLAHHWHIFDDANGVDRLAFDNRGLLVLFASTGLGTWLARTAVVEWAQAATSSQYTLEGWTSFGIMAVAAIGYNLLAPKALANWLYGTPPQTPQN